MTKMRQVTLFAVLCSLFLPAARGQIWVHSPTPGVNPSRDSHYSDLDSFGPPFALASTDQFGDSSVTGLFPVENSLLVVSEGGEYRLYSPSGQYSGQASLRWKTTALTLPCPPAYSRGIVILGSSTTTSVQAVNILDGKTLWSGPGVGESVYSSVATGDAVFFHGPQRLVAARLHDGGILWEYSIPGGFAYAPLALSNGLLFVLDKAGTLYALNAATGKEAWSASDAGADGSKIVAAPDLVFVTRYSRITAFSTNSGHARWSEDFPGPSIRGMAYANGRIYTSYPPTGFQGQPVPGGTANTVIALNASSGSPVWEFREDASYPPQIDVGPPRPYWSVIANLFVADGRVYFFNETLGRVRTLDAVTGSLEWSMKSPSVRSMALWNRQLVLKLNDRVEIYRPAHQLYLAEFAAGEGYSTRLTVNNSHNESVVAPIIFNSTSGEELQFSDAQGTPGPAYLSVLPFSSASLVITDDGQPVKTGWVTIDSRLPLTASLIYQYAPGGLVLNEVGVGESRPTDFANVKVSHGGGFSTAIALAVPGDEEAHVFVQLLDTEGNELVKSEFSLGSRHQMAKFFNELLHPDLSFNAFEGTLVLRADQPLIVTALRTKNGTPISSFPVGYKR